MTRKNWLLLFSVDEAEVNTHLDIELHIGINPHVDVS